MLDNQYNWLYFPEGALRMRLIGQLILTKFIEVCTIKGWKVVSANTDGIEVIIPKSDQEEYIKTMDEATKLFNLELEHQEYSFIYYMNVNNYIAKTSYLCFINKENVLEKIEEISIKKKGLFLDKPPLGYSVDNRVIPKALIKYFVDDIDFSEFINNPVKYNLSIYDYCKSNKIDKQYTVYWNGEKQQRLNRYYFQKNAPYLYKQKPNKNLESVNVRQGVRLFNNYEEKDFSEYNINYNYYVKQCRDIVDELNNFNQLSLF